MAKTRTQKEELLQELQGAASAKALVFTKYTGLSVKDLTELRNKLRASSSTYRVTKNTLLKKALSEAGHEIPQDIYDYQVAVAWSSTDEVEPNKIVAEFAKTHEMLGVLGALVNGEFIDAAGVKKLASLPSREELYAKVVGSIAAPLSGLVNVLGGNLRGLVSVLAQYRDSKS